MKLVQMAVLPEPQALGVAEGQAHLLVAHCCPAAHTAPHAPQLLASWVVLAQYVGALTGQAVCPAMQLTAHLPAEHT